MFVNIAIFSLFFLVIKHFWGSQEEEDGQD